MKQRQKHKLADTAQQIVGGFLLAGPFVVTQEVWMLARNMSMFHSMFVAFGSVGMLAFVITAPDLFLAELSPRNRLFVTFRALSVAAVFSVVGAVTTDSLF